MYGPHVTHVPSTCAAASTRAPQFDVAAQRTVCRFLRYLNVFFGNDPRRLSPKGRPRHGRGRAAHAPGDHAPPSSLLGAEPG